LNLTIANGTSSKKPKLSFNKVDITYISKDNAFELKSLSIYESSINNKALTVHSSNIKMDESTRAKSTATFSSEKPEIRQMGSIGDIRFVNDSFYTKSNNEVNGKNATILVEAFTAFDDTDVNLTFKFMEKPVTIRSDSTRNILTVDNTGVEIELVSYESDSLDLNFVNPDGVKKIKLKNPADELSVCQIIGVAISVILSVVCISACIYIVRCEAREQKEEEIEYEKQKTS
jgi:hypothetical protein